MKIIIINASPRKNGNTNIIAEIITKKLHSLGDIEVETIFLADVDIHCCKGCCNCLTVGEEYCPNKDDERKILEDKILKADGVIFASPVYAMNMPALMKNLMDRFAFTMHRPRFFNQYTMIIAITGAFGTKETIKSISQIKYSGFNIVETLGLKATNPLENINLTDKNLIKKIKIKTENFHNKIKKKASIKPTLINLLSFNLQRKYFSELNPKKYADWKYFNEKGWFEPKCNYYTHNIKISFLKNIFSKLLCHVVK